MHKRLIKESSRVKTKQEAKSFLDTLRTQLAQAEQAFESGDPQEMALMLLALEANALRLRLSVKDGRLFGSEAELGLRGVPFKSDETRRANERGYLREGDFDEWEPCLITGSLIQISGPHWRVEVTPSMNMVPVGYEKPIERLGTFPVCDRLAPTLPGYAFRSSALK